MSDSVAKGGSALVFARMLGMVFSFLLFLILARHSPTDAGVFRTVITYIIIAESLGMLGMHRWLSTEITSNKARGWRLFLATTALMLIVAVILMLIYLAISMTGFYSEALNLGLMLAALAVIPTSIYQCVQSTFVGIGKNQLLSKYNATEYAVRCTLGILLIHLDYSVIYVIVVFVLTRWCIALYGLYAVSQLLKVNTWRPNRMMMLHALKDVPKFVIIVIAFLLLRNAGLVLLPAIVNEAETAIFAVAYQLYDLILLIPSVLAITSNHVFVNKAKHSNVALKRISTQFISITSIVLFPCIAVTAAFAQNFLLFLYGDHYILAKLALVFLMMASGFAMVDMVLSQIMLARKDYKDDMHSILFGGLSAVALTFVLSHSHGATGAAAALALATLITTIYRLKVLNAIFSVKLLLTSIWRPALAALITFIAAKACLNISGLAILNDSKYLWIACVPLVLSFYGLVLFGMGGLNLAKRARAKRFLFNQ